MSKSHCCKIVSFKDTDELQRLETLNPVQEKDKYQTIRINTDKTERQVLLFFKESNQISSFC